MNRAQFLALFPHASQDTLNRNAALFDGTAPHERPGGVAPVDPAPPAVVKSTSRHAPAVPAKTQAAYSGRVRVTVTSYRCGHLCDPDNVAPKYFVDCLRYAGLLRDDTRGEIELDVRPEKRVPTRAQEGVEIVITPLP